MWFNTDVMSVKGAVRLPAVPAATTATAARMWAVFGNARGKWYVMKHSLPTGAWRRYSQRSSRRGWLGRALVFGRRTNVDSSESFVARPPLSRGVERAAFRVLRHRSSFGAIKADTA